MNDRKMTRRQVLKVGAGAFSPAEFPVVSSIVVQPSGLRSVQPGRLHHNLRK